MAILEQGWHEDILSLGRDLLWPASLLSSQFYLTITYVKIDLSWIHFPFKHSSVLWEPV